MLGTFHRSPSYFNPRSREGSDPARMFAPGYNRRFQSTLPRGERRQHKKICCRPTKFQSTLPRGERRQYCPLRSCVFPISIHAPARGATTDRGDVPRFRHISIHAPARGATMAGSVISQHPIGFQSTLPRGERRVPDPAASRGYRHFNPRSREGSDG